MGISWEAHVNENLYRLSPLSESTLSIDTIVEMVSAIYNIVKK